MSVKIAENNIVELTWYDEHDSKESIEISVNVEYQDGSGDVWITVGDLSLSVSAWKALMWRIESMVETKGLQEFINRYKVVEGEIKVLSNNSVQWTKATSPKAE